ncbi:MAG: ThuA domain-containing protein [Opitutaceae bacterium]
MKGHSDSIRRLFFAAGLASLTVLFSPAQAQAPSHSADVPIIKVMFLTGQCSKSHDWTKSSPILREMLDSAGIFAVDEVITPPAGADMSGFSPDWSRYDVVVMDYDGDDWPEATKEAFAAFVRNGGGLVSFHATNNAFPDWKPFLEMTGVGGWRGRNESWGPMIRWVDGKTVAVDSPGSYWHPPKHDFLITTREPDHPVMRGLPDAWMHAHDELYAQLRGPAQNVTILATAVADPAQFERSTGENEPMLMAIAYGSGRVFHTTLGHVGQGDEEPIRSVRCVGFMTTLLRGTEWAATGEVTLPVPEDFPTDKATSVRPAGD